MKWKEENSCNKLQLELPDKYDTLVKCEFQTNHIYFLNISMPQILFRTYLHLKNYMKFKFKWMSLFILHSKTGPERDCFPKGVPGTRKVALVSHTCARVTGS
jgi:hypothetical protein